MRFKTLFTIEVLHDYFTSGSIGEIIFTPTEACAAALRGIKAFTKTWGNKLYVIVPAPNGTHPSVFLHDETCFQFFWQPADAQFFSYTALPIQTGKRYYCHNAVAAERGSKKYLHTLPPLHAGGNSYSFGAMVSNASGETFEALANLAAGNSLANDEQWAPRGQAAYLTSGHQVRFETPFPSIEVNPAAAAVSVQLFGFNPVSNFPDTLLHTFQYNYNDAVSQQSLDLRAYPDGLYRMLVNGGNEQWIYLDSISLGYTNVGVISIHHNSTLPAGNALVGAGGELLNPVFTIRLSPPMVIWQYKARTTAVKTVADEGGLHDFENAAPLFTSRLPIRLQQLAYDKMMLEYNNTSPPDPLKTVVVKKLPVPIAGAMQTITKNSTQYLMASIMLNY